MEKLAKLMGLEIPQTLIVLTILAAFLFQNWYLSTHEIPVANTEAIARMQGILDGAFFVVMGYFFGSSSGSKRKDDERMAQNKKGGENG